MSRRRKTDLIERLALSLIKLSPWVSLVLAVVSYVALETYQRTSIAPRAATSFSVVTSAYPAIALAGFVSLGLLSAVHRTKRGRLVDEQTGLESLRGTARTIWLKSLALRGARAADRMDA